jgi:iron complex outermembrane receptor protein
MKRSDLSVAIAAIVSASSFAAEPAAVVSAPVVVTATRTAEASFDLPVSIDSIKREDIQEQQAQVNLSESLARIPGIVAQNRQNYAQDLQISSRGFGARSTFGVRGLRLYSDGIPATMPDGQGQVSHFDLGSAARIEVLRGPFSALYGNSSGGVIALFTEDGAPGAAVEGDVAAGSFSTRRYGLKASGDTGPVNYVLSTSDFSTDGSRDHSSAKRDIYNGKLQFKPDGASKVSFVFNAMDTPEAQDALGLDRSQFDSDPHQAGTNAIAYNTRKKIAQSQGGLNYERTVTDADTFNAMVYYGRRTTTQFQAIPANSQIVASSPGGVIDLVRNYGGTDLRWTHRTELAGMPVRLVGGMVYENVDEGRRGYQNFIGSGAAQVLGVYGSLRRNESNRVFTFDQYLQGEWQAGSRWLLLAGARHSAVHVNSVDHYVVPGNGNDSGSASYSANNPVLGATFKATDALNLYASYGRGFETPTLNELSYRPSAAGTGLNFALVPAKSDHYEMGAKAFLGPDTLATAAVFHVNTHDEIAVLSNTGGRSVYQNVGDTRRDGVELSFDSRIGRGFRAYAAYTYLRAEYADPFRTCTGSPCASPTVAVASGNAIPGIPKSTFYGELSWKDAATGFASGFDVRHVARVFVNDLNSDAAAAYTVADMHFGFEQSSGGWRVKEFFRADNLTDRKYAGSVIVNEGNSRFFEPAPGRNYLVGASLARLW